MVTVRVRENRASVDITDGDSAHVETGDITLVGGGDMLKKVYDPRLLETDIFTYTDERTMELTPIDIDLLLGV